MRKLIIFDKEDIMKMYNDGIVVGENNTFYMSTERYNNHVNGINVIEYDSEELNDC